MVNYEIRIAGRLPGNWSDWFGGLTCTNLDDGQALLAGPLEDQAALYGVLLRIRDLNLTLLSVRRLGAGQTLPNEGRDPA